MTDPDRQMLGAMWARLVGSELSLEKLVARIRHDGGLDVSGLSDEELRQLFDGRFSGNWKEPAFAFSELLALYRGGATHDPAEQTVGWAFAVLSLADALERDVTDLDLQFNNFIDGFVAFKERLTTDESIHILKRFMSYPSPEFIQPPPTVDELLKNVQEFKELAKNDPEMYAFTKMGEKLMRRHANRE